MLEVGKDIEKVVAKSEIKTSGTFRVSDRGIPTSLRNMKMMLFSKIFGSLHSCQESFTYLRVHFSKKLGKLI